MAIPAGTATAAAPTASPGRAPAQLGLSEADRDRLLGTSWRNSSDLLWNLASSAGGLAVLRAPFSTGAAWSQVASLRIAGVESRQWIGQGCLLTRTHTLAVAYGPVEYIGTAALFERGAFAALVNLDSGAVTSLRIRPTFSYFSPACGASGTAQFTSFATGESATSVESVSAQGGIAHALDRASGETTGAITDAQGSLLGVQGRTIVRLTNGRPARVLTAPGTVSQLRTTSGGLIYLSDDASGTSVHRYAAGHDSTVAVGKPGDVAVSGLANGSVAVHGSSVQRRTASNDVRVSTAGAAATPSMNGGAYSSVSGAPGRAGTAQVTITSGGGVSATAPVPASTFSPTPQTGWGFTPVSQANPSSVITDPNLPCAVQRNDPKTEAFQPNVQQVEWAVDQAVAGHLTTARAAGYRGFGLPSYSAQGLFPLRSLTGGGSVPPQVMLGILANESNLWQASSHVTPGGYGNPLTGNIYGRTTDSSGNESMTIDFSQADCGYGIAQVTDNMRTGQLSATSQRAIALDYQVNIAAGLQTLIGKWNQLAGYSPAITMNNGDPSVIENWYAAIWAYNSGLQPNAANGNTSGCTPGPACTDGAGQWGLGWANNPANPIYPPNRHLFNSVPTDASSPSRWPYQERVIGWAAYPIYEPNGSYTQAWWTSDANRTMAIPSPSLFCTAANNCTPGSSPTASGSCNLSNLHCWTNFPVTWENCSTGSCGHGGTAYATTSAEPADSTSRDPADCNSSALPSNAVVVDDLPSGSPAAAAPCHSVVTTGSFNLGFYPDPNGNFPAHIDLHQVNGGLNGHYWFTHTDPRNDIAAITGTWHFPTTVNGWGKVMVHVPALGAQTYQAHYTITDGSTGSVRTRVVNQAYGQNAWISLGAMYLGTNSTVSMTSYSPNDDGSDIAWDAVAFVPTSKPVYKVVALGDSYSSGEGVPPFDSIPNGNGTNTSAYSRLMKLPGQTLTTQQEMSAGVDEIDLIACSGAKTVSITSQAVNTAGQETPYHSHWDSPDYQKGQELQLNQAFADPDTRLVTLTIGGNDARFSDVVQFCMGKTSQTPTNCSSPGQVMPGDAQALVGYEPHVIQDLLPAKLASTYKAIHAAAPNASILVGGYPRLFTPNGADGLCLAMIAQGDKLWLNQMGSLMNNMIQSAVNSVAATGVNIHFVDPSSQFNGHEECTSSPYFNGIDATNAAYSFHPNSSGQAAYAAAFTASAAQWVR